MSEKLFRLYLSELTTVCIRCRNGGCSGKLGMDVTDLRNCKKALHCPVCGATFANPGFPDPLIELGKCIELATGKAHSGRFEVSFVVQDQIQSAGEP
jgi:hypothetical protein